MKSIHYIKREFLTLEQVRNILAKDLQIELSEESRQKIRNCRAYLEAKLTRKGNLYYGINTGFGSLCNIQIGEEDTQKLQHNLIVSHASGMGERVPEKIVRLMLLLKIQNLSYGHSGVREELVEQLIYFYNSNLYPVVYQLGSLGASGDLAPLAHLSLPLIGLGEFQLDGQLLPAEVVLKKEGIPPLTLEAKEGLALLNGTQFSSAYALYCLMKAERLMALADLCAALSIDAFNCRLSPFDARIHQIRPHSGQIEVAAGIRGWLEGSEIAQQEKSSVQDPYAFRCVPQVHGASRDAVDHIRKTVLTEINSVTDNPNIFPDTDGILSGGNFHAQPLALSLDFLAIALAELGSISERRVYQLISGQRELPAFLVASPGLHSGLMIPQYTAASIVSQNKQLCTPASVDSIVSSNGQEDHVSMAANAATKALRVVDNLERLLAIEFMTAAQALEFRRPLRTSPQLEEVVKKYRTSVPFLAEDRVLSVDLQKTLAFLQENLFTL
jgi:histidine ammonia-lyase